MYNYGQYYPQYIPQMQRFQSLEQQYPQTYQQQINGLQGKSVESFDVARAIDIPIDGSISYFPLTDGSAIITKQLQMDGKSKTIIYKPDMSASSETLARTTLTSDESNYIKDIFISIILHNYRVFWIEKSHIVKVLEYAFFTFFI